MIKRSVDMKIIDMINHVADMKIAVIMQVTHRHRGLKTKCISTLNTIVLIKGTRWVMGQLVF